MLKAKNKLLRKSILIAVSAVLCFSMAACSKKETGKNEKTTKNTYQIPLNEDEKELLDAVDEDIHVVTDDNYIDTLVELISHTDEYSGQIYQIEGTFTNDGEVPYVSRELVSDEEKAVLGLPLMYLTKDMQLSTWVRVTGIVNEGEVGGESQTVLEVIAIESIPETGQAQLPWEGNFEHHH